MRATYRPIGSDWKGETRSQRPYSPFRAKWQDTLDLLEHELEELGATDLVIQLDMDERDIRLDGMPRATALPSSPRVILSFDSKHGPLRYQCDAFYGGYQQPGWQANIRAIALGLESLRRVDRYGITKRGEQYTGWKALPANTLTQHEAMQYLRLVVDPDGRRAFSGFDDWKSAYRDAAKKLHPDAGGSREDWDRLQRAKAVLGI